MKAKALTIISVLYLFDGNNPQNGIVESVITDIRRIKTSSDCEMEIDTEHWEGFPFLLEGTKSLQDRSVNSENKSIIAYTTREECKEEAKKILDALREKILN